MTCQDMKLGMIKRMIYPLNCCVLLGRNVHNLVAWWGRLSIVALFPTFKKIEQYLRTLSQNLGKMGVVLGKLLDHRL